MNLTPAVTVQVETNSCPCHFTVGTLLTRAGPQGLYLHRAKGAALMSSYFKILKGFPLGRTFASFLSQVSCLILSSPMENLFLLECFLQINSIPPLLTKMSAYPGTVLCLPQLNFVSIASISVLRTLFISV